MIAIRILDVSTDISAIAFTPAEAADHPDADIFGPIEAATEIVARAGFGKTGANQATYVILVRLSGGVRAEYDPFAWGDLTMQATHLYLRSVGLDGIENGATILAQPLREQVIAGRVPTGRAAGQPRLQAEPRVSPGAHDHDDPEATL